MNDDLDMISFGIIADASEARDLAQKGFEAARAGDVEAARKLLKDSRELLEKARRSQTDVLFDEMNGKQKTVNVLLVHSQDHLTSAAVVLDLVDEMIPVLDEQHQIKERLEKLERRIGNEN